MSSLMRLRDIQDTQADLLGKDYFDPTGKTVYGINNEKVGKINGALVDDTTGRIRYFIVDVGGWFSSKEVLVPAGLARIAGDEVYFDNLTRETVNTMMLTIQTITIALNNKRCVTAKFSTVLLPQCN